MLLEAEALSVRYETERGILTAVDAVSFDIRAGETLGLVGESGCGKSSLGKALVKLNAVYSGRITFDGSDTAGLRGQALRSWRRRIQMAFQDPLSALDPRKTVFKALSIPLKAHTRQNAHQIKTAIHDLLQQVGLSHDYAARYPHELSGGERQRINIARAISVKPELIVCDEPVSALDVSLQAQILNLFSELKATRDMSLLFISHDLAAVGHLSDRIAVMYLGQIVEILPRERLWRDAGHPYTQLLIDSIPGPGKQLENVDHTELPSPYSPPSGCRFRDRCPHAMAICKTAQPVLEDIAPSHSVACHLHRAPDKSFSRLGSAPAAPAQ